MSIAVEPKVFSLGHFREWASGLVLDSGEPLELEWWQEAFIADLFGEARQCWLVVPEGNGKTTLVALIALYYLQFQPWAAIPVAAASREQAHIIYNQAEGFVLRNPAMHELMDDPNRRAKGKRAKQVPVFECQSGFRRIRHFQGGILQVFAADDRTGDGIIPTLCLIDEPHRQRDMSLYRTWEGKLGKRNGQIVAISTAGEPGSEFELAREEIRQAATEPRDGGFVRAVSNDTVLHDWAVPEDGDPEDMGQVKAANPFSGITVESLTRKFASPTMTLGHWRRFVCNLPTRSEFAAITEAEWFDALTAVTAPDGEPCMVGLDVAWKWDTTAAVPLWSDPDGVRFLGPAKILVPPQNGNSLDPSLVEHALLQIHQANPISTVVMDMSRAEQLASWIETELGATVVDWSQQHKQAATDFDRFMEGLRSGHLRHTGDEGLTRHALNAVARILPQGDARFERPAQSRVASMQDHRVIDALIAAAMVNCFAAQVPPDNPFVEAV